MNSPLTDGAEEKKPMWAKCAKCKHCWPCAYLPLELAVMGKLLDAWMDGAARLSAVDAPLLLRISMAAGAVKNIYSYSEET